MEELFNPSLFGGVVAVICFFFSIGLLNTLIRVCPPRQVLVVTGTKTQVQDKEYGFRLQKGGWTLVIPYFQGVQTLDLSRRKPYSLS